MNPNQLHPNTSTAPRSRWLGPALLLALWLVGVALMLHGAANPADFDPASERYGANWRGDLSANLGRSVLELLVLAAVLRAWSFPPAPRRLLAALGMFLPWTLIHTIATMHAGPITGRHVLWLWIVCAVLVAALPVTEFARRFRPAGDPA